MNLTRREKNRIIKTLQKAKTFVSEGSLVCVAVLLTNSIPSDKWITRDYISSLIYPRLFVTEWLYIQHGIVLTHKQAAEYRLAWIDHMIEELSE